MNFTQQTLYVFVLDLCALKACSQSNRAITPIQAPTVASMATLLQLPREIRDRIYRYVVLVENKRQDLDQTFSQFVDPRTQRIELAPRPTMSNLTVLYLLQEHLSTFAPLMLVNHQMNAEISRSLAWITSPLAYSLDIIILDEILLLPTWLSVPVHRVSVDVVNVAFRIAGSFNREERYNKDGPYAKFPSFAGFNFGDGGGQAIGYQLYEILDRFVKFGAVGETADSKFSKHVTAKHINIDLLTPEGVPLDKFVEPMSRPNPRRLRRDVQGGVLDPRYLVRFISSQLTCLLTGYGWAWFQYGKLLFEHMNEIVLSRDGVESKRWDIAECLQTLTVDERYVSREGLVAYKDEAWKSRRARGLKVLGE